jgi:hypothetical protein
MESENREENNEDELMGTPPEIRQQAMTATSYRKDLDYNMNELIIFSMRGATKIE